MFDSGSITGLPALKNSGTFEGSLKSLKGPGLPGCTKTSANANNSGSFYFSIKPNSIICLFTEAGRDALNSSSVKPVLISFVGIFRSLSRLTAR